MKHRPKYFEDRNVKQNHDKAYVAGMPVAMGPRGRRGLFSLLIL